MAIKLKNKKAVVGIAVMVALLTAGVLLPLPEGLTRAGLCSICIFLSAIDLWVTEAFPISVSAIFLILLMPFFGVMTYSEAVGNFGTGTVLFIMATAGITIMLVNSTIPLRITALIIRLTKGKARWIILGFCLAGGLLSGIMSSLATCALFYGFVIAMLKTAGCTPGKSGLGRALLIALPVCCGIGGFLTPAGTPGNVLMMELMENYGIHMTFAKWTMIGLPIGLFAIFLVAFWLPVVFHPEDVADASKQAILKKERELPRWTGYEKKAVIVILLMLICWFAGSWVSILNTTTVAVFGMLLMFLPGMDLLNWKTFSDGCDWNLVFIMGTASILMIGVSNTGAMDWVVNLLFSGIVGMNTVLMWIVIAVSICVLRAFVPTTTAVIALFVPMLYSIANMTGQNVAAMLMIPAFWGPAAMLLLYTEPIFYITFGDGYYTEGDLLKFGWLPSLIMAVLIALIYPVYIPMLGF